MANEDVVKTLDSLIDLVLNMSDEEWNDLVGDHMEDLRALLKDYNVEENEFWIEYDEAYDEWYRIENPNVENEHHE